MEDLRDYWDDEVNDLEPKEIDDGFDVLLSAVDQNGHHGEDTIAVSESIKPGKHPDGLIDYVKKCQNYLEPFNSKEIRLLLRKFLADHFQEFKTSWRPIGCFGARARFKKDHWHFAQKVFQLLAEVGFDCKMSYESSEANASNGFTPHRRIVVRVADLVPNCLIKEHLGIDYDNPAQLEAMAKQKKKADRREPVPETVLEREKLSALSPTRMLKKKILKIIKNADDQFNFNLEAIDFKRLRVFAPKKHNSGFTVLIPSDIEEMHVAVELVEYALLELGFEAKPFVFREHVTDQRVHVPGMSYEEFAERIGSPVEDKEPEPEVTIVQKDILNLRHEVNDDFESDLLRLQYENLSTEEQEIWQNLEADNPDRFTVKNIATVAGSPLDRCVDDVHVVHYRRYIDGPATELISRNGKYAPMKVFDFRKLDRGQNYQLQLPLGVDSSRDENDGDEETPFLKSAETKFLVSKMHDAKHVKKIQNKKTRHMASKQDKSEMTPEEQKAYAVKKIVQGLTDELKANDYLLMFVYQDEQGLIKIEQVSNDRLEELLNNVLAKLV